eukprot:7314902-Alexandrium_andersonii.AAC.1
MWLQLITEAPDLQLPGGFGFDTLPGGAGEDIWHQLITEAPDPQHPGVLGSIPYPEDQNSPE